MQAQPALDACARIGRVHYIRGVKFTADNWVTVKSTIADVVLAENGIVRLGKSNK